jgi:hypothetical protein
MIPSHGHASVLGSSYEHVILLTPADPPVESRQQNRLAFRITKGNMITARGRIRPLSMLVSS